MFKAHPSNQSHFASVPSVNVQRSQFDRSHNHKTTIFADNLYPLYIEEVIPGDTFNVDQVNYARLATPVAPIMDSLYLDTFFFFVPNRLVWENWTKFMGEKEPDDTTDYTPPKMTGLPSRDDLWDHFGLPDITSTLTINDEISALPFRAYSKIIDDWFKDQNLQDNQLTTIDDGPDSFGEHPVRKRAKRHDYFTSALPWPQKGDAVELPLGISAPVWGDGKTLGLTMDIGGNDREGLVWDNTTAAFRPSSNAYNTTAGSTVSPTSPGAILTAGVITKAMTGTTGIYTDLSEATAATINSLREAFQLQRMLERDARSGTRYVEVIKAHFGVTSPDFRLQRSEYLGGSSQMVNISPVTQTAQKATADTDQTPLGTVGGMGTAIQRSGFTKSFTEHGWVIGLVNLRSQITYQQGVNRMFTRTTKYDYAWPALMHLGEQEVLKREIFFIGGEAAADTETWAYQERYAEYRYHPSVISGQFRSTDATPLDVWHLAEEFGSCPTFNEDFIEANTPMFRVLAVPGTEQAPNPHMYIDSLTTCKAARCMPTYSVPGLIDHF